MLNLRVAPPQTSKAVPVPLSRAEMRMKEK